MNFTLNIFDLFAYTIPGSLYLVVLLYISDRLDWLDLRGAENLNTAVLLIGAALASYLLVFRGYAVESRWLSRTSGNRSQMAWSG
jgi:hypothetical protein